MGDQIPTRQQDAVELTSWKNISTYLGVTIRTAQNWERDRQLPVHRLPGKRSVVHAQSTDLDAWRRSQGIPSVTPSEPRRRPWVWLVVVCLGIAIAASIFLLVRPPVTPTGWQVSGDTFIATGTGGRELWSYKFDGRLDESTMRSNGDYVSFVDLDGDGTNEVLVSAHFLSGQLSQPVVCFSNSGRELWRFTPGREVRTRNEVFVPLYHVAFIKPMPRMPDGKRYLVISAHHRLYYPNQLAVLGSDGKLVREYWHSGHLSAIAFADLDRDGEPEVYLGGVSNGNRTATLVGLKLHDIEGASQESKLDYQLLGFRPAHEMVRVLFARSDLNQVVAPFNAVGSIASSDSSLELHLNEALGSGRALAHYRLDSTFAVADVSPGDYFPVEHDELFRQGRLNHKYDRRRDIDPLRDLTYLRRP